jgi:acyl-coenzyme A thioesterase PaaI-like protein
MSKSLQEQHAPATRCFGCGPANELGLRIRSFPAGDEVVCEFHPEPHHESFAGAVSGGIVSSLFDCHLNWTAAHQLMQRLGLEHPPCTVTAELTVRFLAPTPSGGPLRIHAKVAESSDRKAVVEGWMEAGGATTATCRAVFVSVKPGHPAYHRW